MMGVSFWELKASIKPTTAEIQISKWATVSGASETAADDQLIIRSPRRDQNEPSTHLFPHFATHVGTGGHLGCLFCVWFKGKIQWCIEITREHLEARDHMIGEHLCCKCPGLRFKSRHGEPQNPKIINRSMQVEDLNLPDVSCADLTNTLLVMNISSVHPILWPLYTGQTNKPNKQTKQHVITSHLSQNSADNDLCLCSL